MTTATKPTGGNDYAPGFADSVKDSTGEPRPDRYLSDYQRGFCDGVRHANSGDKAEQTPLSKLDARDLAALRAIILRVIDDGCTCDGDPNKHSWELVEGVTAAGDNEPVSEAVANEQRLRFCDAIQAAIVQRAAPATTPAVRGGAK